MDTKNVVLEPGDRSTEVLKFERELRRRVIGQDEAVSQLHIELDAARKRVSVTEPERIFDFRCTNAAKEFLLTEGTDPKYGARHLKRAIERRLVLPLSSFMATGHGPNRRHVIPIRFVNAFCDALSEVI